jgi:MarR family transcriptional regulator, lower aerobic nicotinate degradation pathway regulator
VEAHGLTPTQFAALCKAVEVGRVTQNLLGRLTAMDPATIQGVVRRLTLRGLLKRTRDPMDRRTAVLAPTEAGVALIARAVACAQQAHEAALAPLNRAEQDQLLALLRRLA